MREQKLQTRIRSAITGLAHVFRANVGTGWTGDARKLPNGTVLISNPRPLSSGLPVGFADLVGWRSVTITEAMVGSEIAQFVALEVKSDKGRPTTQQLSFLAAVRNSGGIAGVVRSEEDAVNLLTPGLDMTDRPTMTATEFCEASDQLGMTQAQLAEKLGVSTRTISHWRSGTTPVPKAVALLIPYLTQKLADA